MFVVFSPNNHSTSVQSDLSQFFSPHMHNIQFNGPNQALKECVLGFAIFILESFSLVLHYSTVPFFTLNLY